MQFISLLTAGIAFTLARALALPAARELDIKSKQFAGNPFELTDLVVDRVEAANVSMIFTIHNPDPLSNMTSDCTGTWPYGSRGWPSDIYQPCLNGSFAWHMKDFVSWTQFSLELKDTFKDPDVGDPPYDQVTIFGKGEFTDDVMGCESYDNGTETCTQEGGSIVRAPIDRSIAKLR